jgi:hypothetical protein
VNFRRHPAADQQPLRLLLLIGVMHHARMVDSRIMRDAIEDMGK